MRVWRQILAGSMVDRFIIRQRRTHPCNRPTLVVSVVLAVTAKVAVMVAVPVVVVFVPAALALPVTVMEPVSIVVWLYPASPWIDRTRPISVMPFVVVSHWIPITINPHEIGTRAQGPNVTDSWWRS